MAFVTWQECALYVPPLADVAGAATLAGSGGEGWLRRQGACLPLRD